MIDTSIVARRIIVRGRVQGVFYRNWAVDTARRHALSGWVRNRGNGDVEILAMGRVEDLEDFASECRRGPFGAKVEDVSSEKAPREPVRGFERRPTV